VFVKPKKARIPDGDIPKFNSRPKPAGLRKALGDKEAKPLDFLSEEGKTPPDYFDEVALAEWNRILPILVQLDLYTDLDKAALEVYCSAYSRYRTAYTDTIESGQMGAQNADGRKFKNPSVQIAQDSARELSMICNLFGMSPSSRQRMGLSGEDAEKLSGSALWASGKFED